MKVLVATAVLVARAAIAHAGDGGPFVSFGGTLGFTSHDAGDTGFTAGGEVSGGYFWFSQKHGERFGGDPRWVGAYADMVHDWATDKTRASFGPEFGGDMLGLDGGFLVETSDEDMKWGIAIRPCITLALVGVCARYGRYFDNQPSSFVEVDLLLKIPLPIDK